MRNLRTLLLVCLLVGCRAETAPTSPTTSRPTPPVAMGISASEAKTAFDSPQALTEMLEKRWPIAAIQEFCIPERRHDNRYQNLVALGVVWEGNLHQNASSGFDKIAWYATTQEGRSEKFSLGIWRGADFWVLEGGSEQTVQRPPNFSPDPNAAGFVGRK